MALELIIDTEGSHAGEHWIVGGTRPIDITGSTARKQHVDDFTAAGAVKRLRFGGDIVRKAYPPMPESPTIELMEAPELPTADAIAQAVFDKQRALWTGQNQ